MANFISMSWDESLQASVCYRCGHVAQFRPTGSYAECPECKKLHLLQDQNEILKSSTAQVGSVTQSGEGPQVPGYMISVGRLLLVYLVCCIFLPHKILGAAMPLSVIVILALDKFSDNLSEFVRLSQKERIVHWLLLPFFIYTAITG